MIVLHTNAPGSAQPTVHVSRDLAVTTGELVAAAIQQTIQRHGRCRLGLSGGSTPAPVFRWLSTHLPHAVYRQLWVTWCDERILPVIVGEPGAFAGFDPESNLRLAYENWLAHVPLSPRQVLPLALSTDAKTELLRFGREFASQFDNALDVAFLGVGPDGHVASLFPGHPGLDVVDTCLAVHDSPKPPTERISLALPVLDRTRVVVVAAEGAKKADMLAQAWAGAWELPVARVRGGGDLHWVLDPAAAQGILDTAAQQ